MTRIRTDVFAMLLLSLGAALTLSACGGGGSSASTTMSAAGTVSGAVVKGPVSGSTVTAYGVNANGTMGPMLGSATTDAHGEFMLSIGNYAGALMLEASGGTYTDEAAGVNMTMRSGDMMTAAMPAFAAGSMVENVHITPLTSMAEAMAEHMRGGLSDANITMAGAMSDFIASAFNVSGVTAADMDALMQQLIGSDGHMMH